MRILQVINSLEIGGAERVLCNLLIQLSTIPGIECEVAVIRQEGSLARQLVRHQIPVTNLGSGIALSPAAIWKLWRIIRNRQFDLVHTHLFPANYLAGIASVLCLPLPPLVHTEHSAWNRRRSLRVFRPLELAVYRRFSRIIGVSTLVCESLRAWLPQVDSRVTCIPNAVPIPPKPQRSYSPKGTRLLFAGRLSDRAKGLDVLLRALAMTDLEFTLKVAGDGKLSPEFKALSCQLGLKDQVQFVGITAEIDRLLDESDLLVLPSRWEGLPLILLESMARGCPVIASSVGGVPELITDGKTGWLVSPEDPSRLAAVLNRVAAANDIREEVASNAYWRVRERYSIELTATLHLKCYESLTSN